MPVELFDDPVWQMSWGERAAVEGLLSTLRPALAIEIGSMEGACLRRIAMHAGEVHSFDLQPPVLPLPGNVTLHTGDSHELLPRYLAELAERGGNVDFVMVDGDHTPEGVRRDLEDLLDSRALRHSVIVIHDIANERVRAGVDAVRFAAWPKVVHVELDWIPGQLFAEPALRNELWYGLGLVLVDVRGGQAGRDLFERRYHPLGPLMREMAERVRWREDVPVPPGGEADALREQIAGLRGELTAARRREAELSETVVGLTHRVEGAEQALEGITGSVSWRITEPLRVAKRRGRHTRG